MFMGTEIIHECEGARQEFDTRYCFVCVCIEIHGYLLRDMVSAVVQQCTAVIDAVSHEHVFARHVYASMSQCHAVGMMPCGRHEASVLRLAG